MFWSRLVGAVRADLEPLPVVPEDVLREVVAILGADGAAEEEMEKKVLRLVGERMLARRLIDWFPEVFGLLLIGHMGKVRLPKTFKAKAADDCWIEFDFKVEPLVGAALKLGAEFIHQESNLFRNIALRSSMVDAVNKALNAGASLDGAVLAGPALLGIPARVYAGRA